MPICKVNGIELYYDEIGTGTPVMLITGLGGVGAAWGPQISLFGNKFRTIVPDHRGRGRSTMTMEGHEIDQLASDMAECLRKTRAAPAHLVGSSLGGAIALRMALDHPDVVRSLTLVASLAKSDEYIKRWFRFRTLVVERLGHEVEVELMLLLLHSPTYLREHWSAIEEFEKAFKAAPSSTQIEVARMDMVMRHDCLAQLSEIKVPALILAGADDAITPPYLSEQLSAGIAASCFRVLERTGHYIQIERPELFFEIVGDFIEGLERR